MGKATVVATLERDSARAELARLGMELATCQNERIRREAQSAQQRAEAARSGREEAARTRQATEQELNEKIERIAETPRFSTRSWPPGAPRRPAWMSASRTPWRSSHASRKSGSQLLARAALLTDQQAAMANEQQQLLLRNEEEHRQTESLRVERQRLEARKTEIEQEAERGQSAHRGGR